jgi:hypothetical protein
MKKLKANAKALGERIKNAGVVKNPAILVPLLTTLFPLLLDLIKNCSEKKDPAVALKKKAKVAMGNSPQGRIHRASVIKSVRTHSPELSKEEAKGVAIQTLQYAAEQDDAEYEAVGKEIDWDVV